MELVTVSGMNQLPDTAFSVYTVDQTIPFSSVF
jgi:hypothetical protein